MEEIKRIFIVKGLGIENQLFIKFIMVSYLASQEASISNSNIFENSVNTINSTQKIMLMK